jgi:hypothetical protein
VLRTAALVSAVAAAVLLVAGAASLLGRGSSNGVGADGTATPGALASDPEPAECQPADVVFTAEPWGGAAGSRGTVVTVALAENRYPCVAPVEVAGTLTAVEGTSEVGVGPAGNLSGRTVLLDPEASFSVTVVWSNQCGDDPAGPVGLSLGLGNWPANLPVDVPAGGADLVPPCNDGWNHLSVSELQPPS